MIFVHVSPKCQVLTLAIASYGIFVSHILADEKLPLAMPSNTHSKGRQLMAAGLYGAAIDYYAAQNADSASDVKVQLCLGGCYAEIGMHNRAISVLEEAINDVEDDDKVMQGLLHAAIASVCSKSNRPARAVLEWAKAEACCPHRPDFQLGMCVALADLGDWHTCLEHADELLADLREHSSESLAKRFRPLAEQLRGTAVRAIVETDAGLDPLANAYQKYEDSKELQIELVMAVSGAENCSTKELNLAIEAVRKLKKHETRLSQNVQFAMEKLLRKKAAQEVGVSIRGQRKQQTDASNPLNDTGVR